MGGESEPHRASFNSPAITGLADVLGDGAYTRKFIIRDFTLMFLWLISLLRIVFTVPDVTPHTLIPH